VTAEPTRPWWASDGPVEGGVDRRSDPLELHRAARRGRRPETPWWADPETDQTSDPAVTPADGPVAGIAEGTDRPAADESARHGLDTCGVCPFCSAMRLLQESRPELVDHLTEAARHLAAAARSLLEPPAPPMDDAAEGGLHRIHLDDHAGAPPASQAGDRADDPDDPTRTPS
jgi:hypothetical protein